MLVNFNSVQIHQVLQKQHKSCRGEENGAFEGFWEVHAIMCDCLPGAVIGPTFHWEEPTREVGQSLPTALGIHDNRLHKPPWLFLSFAPP